MEKYFPIKKAITTIKGDNYLKATKNKNEYHLFLSPTIFKDFLTEEKANNLYALKGESSGDSSIDLSPYAKKSELEPYLTEEEGDQKYKLKSDNIDLSPYLKSEVAQSTYAKKTDLSSYLTEDEANSLYALKGESSESDPIDLSDYAKKSDLDEYIEETRADNKYALKSDIDEILTTDTLQEFLTDYELTSAVDNKISSLKTEIQDNYYKKDDDLNVDLTDYQKKSEMSEYVTKSEIPEGGITGEEVRQIVNEILNPLKEDYNTRLSEISKLVNSNKSRGDTLLNEMSELSRKSISFDTSISSLNRKLSTAENNINSLKEDVSDLKPKVLALEYAIRNLQ